MNSRHSIDADRQLLFIHYTGAVTVDQVIDSVSRAVADEAFRPGMNAVCDLTQAQVNWSLADLNKLIPFVHQQRLLSGKSRAAAVFAKGSEPSTARLFIGLYSVIEPAMQLRLFEDHAAALEWVTAVSQVSACL